MEYVNDYSRQLESARAARGVTGASFAYWDGNRLHTAVAGLRNSVIGDPVTVDTVMHIGSITKVFNTVLMMQLVDEGRIALEDPVVKHLPELRLKDMGALRQITCAMLVNHTSGIDCDLFPDYGPDQERVVDAVSRLAEVGQLHPPGGGPAYCNSGFVIAGYLTQKLRGESWYRLVKTRLFEPLGMRHALADLTDLPRFRHSVGDVTDPLTGRLVQTTRPFLPLSFAPAGTTLMMSATDLVTFARALLNGGLGPNGARILSETTAARMTEPTIALLEHGGAQWGLGWMLLPGGVLHHSGGGPGVCSVLYAHRKTGRAFALLTNCDRWDALKSEVVDPILESWTGIKESIPAHQTGTVDPKPYEGVYENGLFRAEVSSRNGTLALRLSFKTHIYDNAPEDKHPPATLYPLDDHTFEATGALPGYQRAEYRFVHPDGSGRMQALACMLRLLMRVR